jgi:hypothetical protein
VIGRLGVLPVNPRLPSLGQASPRNSWSDRYYGRFRVPGHDIVPGASITRQCPLSRKTSSQPSNYIKDQVFRSDERLTAVMARVRVGRNVYY